MPWCPTCRNEYREGIKICADCGAELVEKLEEPEDGALFPGDEERMEELKKYLEHHQQEAADMEEEKAPAYKGVYLDSAKQAEENRSSGYMLIVVGGIGLGAVICLLLDIIKLPAGMVNKYMLCFVVGALFLLFFVMGIVAVRSSESLKEKAESESTLTGEMKKWCEHNITAESVDNGLFPEGETGEEIKYFRRTDKIKAMISRQFMNLDESFLDAFVDDYYPVIFEQEEKTAEIEG